MEFSPALQWSPSQAKETEEGTEINRQLGTPDTETLATRKTHHMPFYQLGPYPCSASTGKTHQNVRNPFCVAIIINPDSESQFVLKVSVLQSAQSIIDLSRRFLAESPASRTMDTN